MLRFWLDCIGSIIYVKQNTVTHKVYDTKRNALFIFTNPLVEPFPDPSNVFSRNLKLKTLVDEFDEVDEVIVVAHFMESSAQEWGCNIHGP